MKTAVINNREGLVQGQLQPISKNLSGAPIPYRAVTFLPGVNLIPTEELDELRKNKSFELNFTTAIQPTPAPEQNPERVGKPILEVLKVKGKDGKDVPLVVDDNQPLAGLSMDAVKALVEETIVVGYLRKWLEEEHRPDRAHLISQRIRQLENDPKAPGGPAAAIR
jgi:hypothetical protein